MKNKIIAFLLLCASSLPSHAETSIRTDYTGDLLLKTCKEDRNFCKTYIIGMVRGIEAMTHMYAADLQEKPLFCVPPNVTSGQIGEIVIKYLKENPQRSHEPSPLLALLALGYTYPCK